ncbi:helix-turn-helix domain-containing protein [Actinokineospora sp. NPDC004072]
MEQLDSPRPSSDGGGHQNLLYTPAEAAIVLAVKESWLLRSADQRRIPCTFLGKHLRFSRADLQRIVATAHRPARPAARTRRT